MSEQSRSWGGVSVSLTPSPGQTKADVEEEFTRSREFIAHLREGGTQEWASRFRRLGWLKVMVAKEVGPPPWRVPRVLIRTRRPLDFWHFTVGWRHTAYRLIILFQRQDRSDG